MNDATVITGLGGLRTIGAMFPSGSQMFSYLVPAGDDPKVGDLLITSVSLGTDMVRGREGELDGYAFQADMKIAVVREVHVEVCAKANRFYVQLLSAERLRQTFEANRQLLGQHRKKAQARAQLDRMLKDRTATSLYEELAKSNPEAARLLDILKE